MLQVPETHKKGVTCISAIMVSHTDAIFASSSSDGVVSVWELIFPSRVGGEFLERTTYWVLCKEKHVYDFKLCGSCS